MEAEIEALEPRTSGALLFYLAMATSNTAKRTHSATPALCQHLQRLVAQYLALGLTNEPGPAGGGACFWRAPHYGEIRGAEFEQASRHYRSTYASPVMPDQQLAMAIATAF